MSDPNWRLAVNPIDGIPGYRWEISWSDPNREDGRLVYPSLADAMAGIHWVVSSWTTKLPPEE